MTHPPQPNAFDDLVELLAEHGFDGMAQALTLLLNEALKLERAEALGAAPFERTEHRRGDANGFKPKTVRTRVGAITVDVPQTRGVDFYPSSLERGERSERALKLAVAERYVPGVSTRKVAAITQKLCGLDVSGSQVSRAAQRLEEELQPWRNRPLGEIPCLILDARYEKIRHGGCVIDGAVLLAIGITPEGKRCLLGVRVSRSEAEVQGRELLTALAQRGIHGVRLITSDDHAGLGAARKAVLPGVPWQRCRFHRQQNAIHYVPKVSLRKQVAADIHNVFDAPDRAAAEGLLGETVAKYHTSAPKLAAWLEQNIPEGLTVMTLPAAHRRRLRTTNMLERVNQEIKRRTRVATRLPNDDSLLRLVSAVLIEISEDWETGKVYRNAETE